MIPYEYDTLILLGNLKIAEPVTAITDIFVTLTAFIVCRSLSRYQSDKTIWFWYFFFFFMGLGSFLGALSHGLKYYMSINAFIWVWLAMHLMSGFSMYFAQRATIEYLIKDKENVDFYKNVIFLQLLLYMLIVFTVQDFLVVVINIAVSLLPLMFILFNDFLKTKRRSSLWVSIGILCTFFPAIINGLQLSYSKWLNHKDISHFFIMLSLALMGYGAIYYHRKAGKKPTSAV